MTTFDIEIAAPNTTAFFVMTVVAISFVLLGILIEAKYKPLVNVFHAITLDPEF